MAAVAGAIMAAAAPAAAPAEAGTEAEAGTDTGSAAPAAAATATALKRGGVRVGDRDRGRQWVEAAGRVLAATAAIAGYEQHLKGEHHQQLG